MDKNPHDHLKDPAEMSPQERKREIKRLSARLKALTATPRSDWHREFERILRIEAEPYGKDVRIETENTLGEDPPRTDYIILDDKEKLMRGKEIFRIFRKHNIIEYKNPSDALNKRTIWKACAYASLYIGTAEHEGDIPDSEVSLSIFRARKNKALFDTMMLEGKLEAGKSRGIYHVKNLISLPFQIVITDELEGDGFALYRALTEHASAEDVGSLIQAARNEASEAAKERYQKILEFIEFKNPGIVKKVIGGNENMDSVLMNILKPQIDERIQAAVEEAVEKAVEEAVEKTTKATAAETTRNNLFLYTQKGILPLDIAAREANMSTDLFTAQMQEAGYKVPQTA